MTVTSNDRGLDGELEGTGVSQHPWKLEYCSDLGGTGSRAIERELAIGYYIRG